MIVASIPKQAEVDFDELLSALHKLALKTSVMSLFTLLQILELNQWARHEDDGTMIVMVHPYRIPRKIRITKEDPVPAGMVQAILKAAGIVH